MANPSGHNHIILVLLILLSCLTSVVHHADAALSLSYNFSVPADLNSTELKYLADASAAGHSINLTKGLEHDSKGRVYHLQPVRLWNHRKQSASFSRSFSFNIGGNDSHERGDGMAFFIGSPGLPSESGSRFLGLFSNPSSSSSSGPGIVGVEFDTNRNDVGNLPDPPAPIADHIGIDINDIVSKNTTGWPNDATPFLYGNMSANITYDGGSRMMKVWFRLADGSTYDVSTPVDFMDAGVPQYANVGFSAATGELTESHHLYSWSFSSTDPPNGVLWIVLTSVASASIAGIVAALLWIIIVRRRRRPVIIEIELQVARKFSYHELSVATGNFSEERSLGAGAFGQVFGGDLRDRRMPAVAVKRLMTPTLERTRRDYVTEITTLGQLSHRNLVKLIGWCDGGGRDNYLFLVYELVTNQSLDKHLHEDGAGLAWPEGYKVVLGIGTAIDYLHTGYRNPILHRDIKPSNVMLDDEFEAKLGDFGLVRPVSTGQGSLRDTTMVGSWGYMDPRCITTGTASTASDIYSFGVLLLEVATGKEPVVVPDEENGLFPNTLVDAVRRSYARGAVLEMADDRLNGEFDMAQMERVLRVGLLCVQEDRGSRSGIKDVLNLLSNIKHPLPQVTIYP